ncbi:MAG: precorrin-8X methylmutase [Chloroflexi bacterium]|nr:precorrin-8X methylmutase [Chloroflexota bacterium]
MSLPGIILLAHGSRGEQIEGARLKEITALLQAGLGNSSFVQPAFLQFNQPDLEAAVASLFHRGIKDVIVLPYFLFEGAHFNRHIPDELRRLSENYPGINIRMAKSLGIDSRIVDVLQDRLEEITGGCVAHDPGPAGGLAGGEADPRQPVSIEKQSFALISQLYPGIDSPAEGPVRKRVLHATANPEISSALEFHPRAMESGLAALRAGKPIIADVRMVAVGINRKLASDLGCNIFCAIEQSPAGGPTENAGVTRTATGIRRLAPQLARGVAVIGNAPTALLAVLDLLDQGAPPPALIVGVPVGFIKAAESKERLAGTNVPYITLPGRLGGSPIAVACINALLHLAAAPSGGVPDASVCGHK